MVAIWYDNAHNKLDNSGIGMALAKMGPTNFFIFLHAFYSECIGEQVAIQLCLFANYFS